MSSRELIFFDESGASYQPVKHYNQSTGRSAYRVKPPGASNKTADFLELDTVEEVAKAMLVDGYPARVKATNNSGPVSVLRFGADLLKRYELNPAIAQKLGIPAQAGGTASRQPSALSKLRERFLARFPNFEGDGDFAASRGSYYESFRSRVDALLSAAAAHPTGGWAVLRDVLTASQSGRGALPPFFDGDVNWRVPRARDLNPATFDAALDSLVASVADPAAAAVAFNETLLPRLEAIGQTNTFRDTRVVPSTILAAVAPNQAVSARYTPYVNAERLINDRPLFANKPLSADEYRAVLALAKQIRAAMVEWGWRPRDLWDVHGFILATCGDRDLEQSTGAVAAQPAEDKVMPEPTNLIVYGPPGTGKTYATAMHAVRLCDGLGDDDPLFGRDQRDALMERYKELARDERIEFVTFHQSTSYEEFVEGLRPETGAGAGFELKLREGIFRRIARRAQAGSVAGGTSFSIGDRQVFKMSIGEAANPDDAYLFEEAIAGGYTLLGFGNIDWSDPRFADRAAMISAVHAEEGKDDADASSGRVQMPYIFRNWMNKGDLVVVSKGNSLFRAIGEVTGDYEYAPRDGGDYSHRRAVRWLWVDRAGVPVSEIYPRNFTMKSVYALTRADLNVPALERYIASGQAEGGGTPEPFVLVIDEINRGNISKIFGELITLLEADKRLGALNELKVRLPYSGESFGVPANLHVVGTMNTADRSIALLDTALRRRFDFEELMPRPDLLGMVGGIDLQSVLTNLNERIEYLFDREHQIGHAYLLSCMSATDVHEVMRHRIIPLLAEYFYEDWTKVGAVLGDVFPDDGKTYKGGFLDRRALPTPFSNAETEEASFRYRWSVRPANRFTYDRVLQTRS